MNSREQLGALGEEIIAIWLTSQGKTTLSDDKWDSVKDIIFSGINIEIKTQCRLDGMNMLSVERRETNLKKCMEVDELVFVEYDKTNFVNIWRVQDREHHSDYSTNNQTRMRGFYINKNEIGPGCQLLARINLPVISSMMRKFSTSEKFTNY